MEDVIQKIQSELEANADPSVAESGRRFFKEEVRVYGVKTALVQKISKKYFAEVRDLGKEDIFQLCETLFSSGYMEESFIACNWSYEVRGRFEKKDFEVFEEWITKYVTNWATCDTLCNHTVGAFIEKYPGYVGRLREWAKSDNMWMRRAAAVSLIVPAKKGLFLVEAFKIADTLMLDKEDLVQKGYGWLLKEESRTHQREVFDYVKKNRDKMPRTALRYAIEKMPGDLRAEAMKRGAA